VVAFVREFSWWQKKRKKSSQEIVSLVLLLRVNESSLLSFLNDSMNADDQDDQDQQPDFRLLLSHSKG